jgi:HSF-type DNA-binding
MMTQPELYDPTIYSSPILLNVSVGAGGGGGVPTQPVSFPSRLYELLEDADKNGFDHIISWQHGGRSFKVHQPEYFALHIMQSYFAQTKFKSFQRQMNTYGYVLSCRGKKHIFS